MKRLKFKKPFNGFGNVLNLIPEGYRVEGKEDFEMTDGNETYRVRWSEGKGHILTASDKTMVSESFSRLKELMNYKSETTLGSTTGKERLAENEIFTKSLLKENSFAGYGKTSNGKITSMGIGNAIDNTLNKNSKGDDTKDTSDDDYEKVSRGVEYGVHGESEEVENEEVNEEEKPSAGLTTKEKSNIVKKAKSGADIGEKGKNFDKVAAKAAKEYGSEEAGKKIAAASMWKNAKR